MITSKLSLDNQLYIEEAAKPEITQDQLLIKVLSCAICGSDLKITKAGNQRIKEDRTIGHEISGEVVEVGKNILNFKIGDTVSIGADLPCLNCSFCDAGQVNLCSTNLAVGYQFDGGLSQYMIVNEYILKEGPIAKFQNISSDLACLAEPLACAINGVSKSMACFTVGMPKSALIFGGGPMGIFLSEYLNFKGVKEISIIEQNQERVNFISSNTNFNVHKSSENLKRKFDLIFTACPARETHSLSLKLVNTAGVINFFGGLPAGSNPLELDSNSIHYSEIVLMGTHGSNPLQHKEALELIESNKLDLQYMITHKFSLDNIQDAFDVARSGVGQKIIINPNEK
jgi:L-iditol 2-dehydrogenase|tara:strand:- start:4493 stop:5518 length:1026 start_codon:yes stop_codon:yes gene_type:complete